MATPPKHGELHELRCSVAPAVAAERASDRARAGRDASDVSGDLATVLGARFAEWPQATVVDTTAGPWASDSIEAPGAGSGSLEKKSSQEWQSLKGKSSKGL